MDRRRFLSGVFGGVASAGLIVSASPSEIAEFASPLKTGDPLLLDIPNSPRPTRVSTGQRLYDQNGKCVAVVTGVSFKGAGYNTEARDDQGKIHIAQQIDLDITARWISRS